jgi:hypothetical protein
MLFSRPPSRGWRYRRARSARHRAPFDQLAVVVAGVLDADDLATVTGDEVGELVPIGYHLVGLDEDA